MLSCPILECITFRFMTKPLRTKEQKVQFLHLLNKVYRIILAALLCFPSSVLGQ